MRLIWWWIWGSGRARRRGRRSSDEQVGDRPGAPPAGCTGRGHRADRDQYRGETWLWHGGDDRGFRFDVGRPSGWGDQAGGLGPHLVLLGTFECVSDLLGFQGDGGGAGD